MRHSRILFFTPLLLLLSNVAAEDDPVIIVVTRDPKEFHEGDIPHEITTESTIKSTGRFGTEPVSVFYPTTSLATTSKYVTISDTENNKDGNDPSVKPVLKKSTTQLPHTSDSGSSSTEISSTKQISVGTSSVNDIKPTVSDSDNGNDMGGASVKPKPIPSYSTTNFPFQDVSDISNTKSVTNAAPNDKPSDSSDSGHVTSEKPIPSGASTELPTQTDSSTSNPLSSESSTGEIPTGIVNTSEAKTKVTTNMPNNSYNSSTSKSFRGTTLEDHDITGLDKSETTDSSILDSTTPLNMNSIRPDNMDSTTLESLDNTTPIISDTSLVSIISKPGNLDTTTHGFSQTDRTASESSNTGNSGSTTPIFPSKNNKEITEATTFLPLTTLISSDKSKLPPWCYRDNYGRVICKKKCGTKKPKKKGKNSSSDESFKVWKPKKPCKNTDRKSRKKEQRQIREDKPVVHRKCHILIILTHNKS